MKSGWWILVIDDWVFASTVEGWGKVAPSHYITLPYPVKPYLYQVVPPRKYYPYSTSLPFTLIWTISIIWYNIRGSLHNGHWECLRYCRHRHSWRWSIRVRKATNDWPLKNRTLRCWLTVVSISLPCLPSLAQHSINVTSIKVPPLPHGANALVQGLAFKAASLLQWLEDHGSLLCARGFYLTCLAERPLSWLAHVSGKTHIWKYYHYRLHLTGLSIGLFFLFFCVRPRFFGFLSSAAS